MTTTSERRQARMLANVSTAESDKAPGRQITVRRDQIRTRSDWQTRAGIQAPDTDEPLAAPDANMAEMIKTISDNGRLDTPIWLWSPNRKAPWFLLAGYRRLTAIRHIEEAAPEAPPMPITALDWSHLSEGAAFAQAFRENEQRKDMTPLDRALCMGRARSAKKAAGLPHTYEVIAKEFGLRRSSAQRGLQLAAALEPRPWLTAHVACRPHTEAALRALVTHLTFSAAHEEAHAQHAFLRSLPDRALVSEPEAIEWCRSVNGGESARETQEPDDLERAKAALKAKGWLPRTDGGIRVHLVMDVPSPSAGPAAIETCLERIEELRRAIRKSHRTAIKNADAARAALDSDDL